jgi:AcrR family transcriptional regulator
MPPNPDKPFESRWRLLCSARNVFARDGYYRASLNEIASNAGVTTGSIYSHFRDKEDLFGR